MGNRPAMSAGAAEGAGGPQAAAPAVCCAAGCRRGHRNALAWPVRRGEYGCRGTLGVGRGWGAAGRVISSRLSSASIDWLASGRRPCGPAALLPQARYASRHPVRQVGEGERVALRAQVRRTAQHTSDQQRELIAVGVQVGAALRLVVVVPVRSIGLRQHWTLTELADAVAVDEEDRRGLPPAPAQSTLFIDTSPIISALACAASITLAVCTSLPATSPISCATRSVMRLCPRLSTDFSDSSIH